MENFRADVSTNCLCNYGSSMANIKEDWTGGCNDDDYLITELFGAFYDAEGDPSIWDSDIRWGKSPLDTASNSNDKHSCNKSIFDSDEDEDIDLVGWMNKRTEEWEKSDTISWLISAGVRFGHSYGGMSPDLAMPGKKLLALTKQEFVTYDRSFGERLFDLLHSRRGSKNSLSDLDDTSEYFSDGEPFSEDDAEEISDGGSGGSVCSSGPVKRSPGRPRLLDRKVKEPRIKLWEFIRNLLLDPKYCPRIICWEKYEERTFRLVKSREVAKLWGERKNDKKNTMNYEKLSRAMRYYYKFNIFESVPGRRLVYRFGTRATGWKTENPNFDSNYHSNKVKQE